MTTVYKYRLRCITTNTYEYMWAETPPTTCPSNTAHTIDVAQTIIVEVNKPDVMTIKEETVPTGGHFSTTAVEVSAAASTITNQTLAFPFPISLLSMTFTIEAQHTGDILNIMPGGKENIIGALSADVLVPTAWTASSYTAGTSVIYSGKTYTCILNTTVANEDPTNATYWRRGVELNVSQTVIDNAKIGYHITLDDGIKEALNEIISIDTLGLKIYIDGAPTKTFAAASYVRQTIYLMHDFKFGAAWNLILGESKIGGSYVPADTPILIEYDNKTASAKTIIGYVEYLY